MSSEVSSSNRSSETVDRRAERDAQPSSERAAGGRQGSSRRTFLASAGAGAVGAGLLADVSLASARSGRGLTAGDEAILRFVAAAEILETDFWQQYNELGGVQDKEVPGGTGNRAYTAALAVLDEDMAQYIHDNTDDEFTHFTFLNAYLKARGGRPVNLDRFRKLPSSKATGAQQIKRLTNLMALTVDTTWWTRYRSSNKNPDFGETFPPRRSRAPQRTVSGDPQIRCRPDTR